MNTLTWNRHRYTAYAPFYDLLVRPLAQGRRRSIAALKLQSGERVLLVGVGTGVDLPLLPPALDLTAIDLTPIMVHRSRTRSQQMDRPLDAVVMNAQALAFGPASFDVVMLHLVLAVVPDPLACIREAARVLQPGGRMAIFDKFLPDTAQASRPRQALNLITATLFSDINRQLGPLLAAAQLRRDHEEPAGLHGAYRVAIATHAPVMGSS